jgi:hypothetical protein
VLGDLAMGRGAEPGCGVCFNGLLKIAGIR